MITILATAAVLSCTEAQHLVDRIDSRDFKRSEYRELVQTIQDSAPRRCHLVAQPTMYKNQWRRHQQRHHQPHRVVIRPAIHWHF